MRPQSPPWSAPDLSERRRTALITLLADEDPAIYQIARKAILSCGLAAGGWLHPHALSSDPVLRRRAREIIGHFARQDADLRFIAFCLQHGEQFDLETAAWQLAATAYPDICIEGYRALLDGYAAELKGRIDFSNRAPSVLGAVNQYLFDELGFRGGDPSNADLEACYFNRVVDRRSGDPINLCLFYLLLARRLHLPVAGIGLPGYFLCRYQSSSDELYVDVYHRGRLLTKADCIQSQIQHAHELPADFLAPISARRLLTQICANLHQAYLQLALSEEATRVQRYLVALRG